MKLEDLKNTRYMQYLAAITASLAIGANTVYTTWLSPSLPKLQSEDSPLGYPITDVIKWNFLNFAEIFHRVIPAKFKNFKAEASWVVAVGLLGSVIICPLAGLIIKKIGPKRSSLYGSIVLLIPWIPIIFAKSVWLLYISRFIAGCATGIAVTIYNSEIADQEIRGKLSNFFTIIKLIAHFIVLALGPFVSYAALCVICALFPLSCICSFYFMPESPYHMIKINDRNAAENILIRLSSKTEDEDNIKAKLLDIENTVQNDMENKTSMRELLTNSLYRRALFILTGMKILHIMNGGQAIESYMQTIIASSESIISPEVSSIIFGAIQFPVAFLASYLLDNLGRKPLLYISTIGCAISLIAEGVYFYIQDYQQGNVDYISWIPTAGIVLFLIMSPLGVSSLPYVLMGELFPMNVKESGVTLMTFFGVIMAFVVSKFYQPVSDAWGLYTVFWIFGGVCVVGCLFTCVFLPETKGKSFSEIQNELNEDGKFIRIASLAVGSNTVYTTWLSPTIPKLQSNQSPLGYPLSSAETSWIVAIGLLGSIVTCPLAAPLIKKIGPKKSLLLGAGIYAVPWIPITFAKSIWTLYAGRFIAGCATGIVNSAVTIYNSEIAEQEIRGKCGNTFTIVKLLAHFVILSIGPFVSYTILCLICALFPLTCICTFYFMPESPYHLIKIGERDAAQESLFKLARRNETEGSVKARLSDIETIIQNDMLNKTTMKEFLKNPLYRKPLFIMTGIKIVSLMNGGQAIESYMQTIIASSQSIVSPETSSVIFGVIQLPAAILTNQLIDKLGRKPLLFISTSGCAVALISEGIYFYIQDHHHSNIEYISWIPTVGIVVYLIMSPLGLSSLSYVLMGELFPINIKEYAVTLMTFFGVSMAFMVSKLYQPVSDLWGLYIVFWIFGGVCVVGCIFAWLFLPETKGKSFSDIQIKLKRNRHVGVAQIEKY
ncbi:sugar transporter-like [Holotrichia oblita]|uniref:Sugar transporter-like n=1 Tax=Holotrichia oblita TaxID=644536 RepID=A0ACB9SQS1_HOLOL|nr:sugar transporter-like [Holotrichia oblita]